MQHRGEQKMSKTELKQPVKFLEAVDDYTSLEQQILGAWQFMAESLFGLKLRREVDGTRQDLLYYASGNRETYGKKVALTEIMRENPAVKEALLGGKKPLLDDPTEYSSTFMLYLGAQLAGRPTVEFTDIAGRKGFGPGRILRSFSTRAMRENYVPHLGVLQRVAVLAKESGKVTLYRQAVDRAKNVRLAALEVAVAEGLTREWDYFNHRISEQLPKPDKIKADFKQWMGIKEQEFDSAMDGEAITPPSEAEGKGKPTASAAPPAPANPTQALAAAVGISSAGLVAAEGVMTKASAKGAAPAKAATPRKRAPKAPAA
jgi:hypothetical protein